MTKTNNPVKNSTTSESENFSISPFALTSPSVSQAHHPDRGHP